MGTTITSEELDLMMSGIIDKLYEKIRESGAVQMASVHYALDEGVTCIWNIELLDHQDVVDLALFINGLNHSDVDYIKLESLKLHPSAIPFEGGNNWREKDVLQAPEEKS